MNNENQQQTADHGVQGRQWENSKDAPRGDPGPQALRIKRLIPTFLSQDPGEKIKFLDDPINKDDQGDAAAQRSQDFMQPKTAQKKSQTEKKQKINQAQEKQILDIADCEIGQ